MTSCLDLQHLAGELALLLRPGALRDVAQITELAETAWRRLAAAGPVLSREDDGALVCFRALAPGRVECLVDDSDDGARPRRVVDVFDVLAPDAQHLWLHLQTAEPCPPTCYASLAAAVEQVDGRHEQARQRWAAAEQHLHAAGLLPVRRHVPSAVGGARFVADLFLERRQELAFVEALDWLDGAVIGRRPAGAIAERNGLTCLTVSVARATDLYAMGRLVQAGDQQKGGVAA